MKHIRLALPNELYDELKALSTHHGHLSHLLRRGVRLVIKDENERVAQQTPSSLLDKLKAMKD